MSRPWPSCPSARSPDAPAAEAAPRQPGLLASVAASLLNWADTTFRSARGAH